MDPGSFRWLLFSPVVVEYKFEDLQQNAGIRDGILRGT
jgi:hypothetical protein